jgi:hypothetical protein
MILLLFSLAFLLFALLFTFDVILLELSKFRVLKTIFDVESQRHNVEKVLFHCLKVVLKIEVESLFVVHVEVVLDLVVEFDFCEFAGIIDSIITKILPLLQLILLACILLIRVLLQFVLFG